MTDSVSKVEIEDVLSSIRRLVAEQAPPAASRPAPADSLLLTPALRVSAPDEEAQGEAGAQPPADEDRPRDAAEDALDAHLSAAPDPEPEAPSAPHDPPLRLVHPGEEDEVEPQVGQEGGGEEGPAPSFVSTRAGSGLEATILELGAAVGRRGEEWDPDGTEPGSGHLHLGLPGAEADPQTGEAGDEEGEGEVVLDEAALRELVAAIVREELQGALGERITRNVRKLVRREIHRVLASEEFD